MNTYWVVDLSNYSSISLGGHWGTAQAGFNISLSGRIWLTDNKKYPSHRNLIDGVNKTLYSGIYSWKKNNPKIYVYPHLEQVVFLDDVQAGLRSLIGVHFIAEGTQVISNCSGNILFFEIRGNIILHFLWFWLHYID